MVFAKPARAQIENRYSLDPAAGEPFGKAVAAAPLVGATDWLVIGVPDIVVGAPDLDVGTRIDQGRVYIFFGPWNPTAQQPYTALTTLKVHSDDLDPASNHGGEFGFSLAVGDLDRQQGADLIVGAPMADKLGPPVALEAGAADIFLNPPPGASDVTRDTHLQDNDVVEDLDNHFGWSVGIGDFANPQGLDLGDVVVGDPDFDYWDPISKSWWRSAGKTYAFYGHYDGSMNPQWNYDSGFFQLLGSIAGGIHTDYARRGVALGVGNYDGDPWDDLAVGIPGSTDSSDDPIGPEGAVFIYRGDGTSLVPPSGFLDESVIWAPGLQRTGTNLFGFNLAWADTDGQDQLDLIIGAPGADIYMFQPQREGAVYIAHAVAGQVPRDWRKTRLNDGSPEAGQRFGWAVAKTQRGGTSKDDVLVGSPHSTALGYADAGEIFVFKY